MKPRGFKDVPLSEIRAVRKIVSMIGEELKTRRKELGFTQESLAEELDISVASVKRIEQGDRMPSLPMLIRFSRALKLNIAFQRK